MESSQNQSIATSEEASVQPSCEKDDPTPDPVPDSTKDQEAEKNKNDVLLNSFLIDGKKYRILLHHDNLVWEKENSSNEKTTVPLVDILAVRLANSSRSSSNSNNNNRHVHTNLGGSSLSISPSVSSYSGTTAVPTSSASPASAGHVDSIKSNYLYIHYACRKEHRRDHNQWRKQTLKLYNTDPYTVQNWHDVLQERLGRQKRPRNILMFVNPFGGRRQALKVFEKYSKPLFQLAGVEISCLISQRSNQIHDILQNNPALYQYDAICCVGGDGTFAEVFNGLMQRKLRDLNLDPQRPKYLPKLRIPIGVIPGGSTDTVAYCLHGTTDVKTAVIHIILGQTRGLDLSSVCNHIGLVRMYASVVCYGFLGDVTLDSEQYRWMGPHRYDYSGFKKFIANRGYEIELTFPEIKTDDTEGSIDSQAACHNGCGACTAPDMQDECKKSHTIDYSMLSSMYNDLTTQSDGQKDASEKEAETKEEWRTVRGKYFMIAGANISCATSRSPNGLAPYCHLGDGHIDIIAVRHTHMFNLLRLLIRLSKENPKLEMLPFVDVYRTRKFLVRSYKTSPNGNMTSSCDLSAMSGSRQPISSAANKSAERTSQWNCDGEILFDTDVLISSHRQLVDVFMRGSYPPPHQGNTSCCGLCGS